MKRFINCFLVILLFFLMSNSSDVKAYDLMSGKYPVHLATNLEYYIDSAATTYETDTVLGILNWNNFPSYVKISTKVLREDNAELRFYYTGIDKGRTVADNTNYTSSTNVYKYSRIQYHLGFKSLGTSDKRETAAHEVGHSLGLNHEDTKPSIMLTSGFRGSALPQLDDWNGIIAKYK